MEFKEWYSSQNIYNFIHGLGSIEHWYKKVYEDSANIKKDECVIILKDMMLELEKDLNQPYYHSDYYKKIEAKIDILEDAIYKIENE